MAGRSKELVPETAEGSWERVAAREVSKVLLLAPPWVVGVLTVGLGSALHVVLRTDDPQTIAWTAGLQTACTLILAAWTWQQSHARSLTGRAHTTLAVLAAGMWVCAATINGPFTVITGRLALIGGITLALSFNIRSIIRRKGIEPAQVADPLSLLFGRGAERAGMHVEARTTKANEHKVEGEVQLDEGRQVADDLAKKVPYIESGIGLPPGSIQTSIDPDHADKAKVTVSDPRVMKRPIPWPGPSRPGGSVADPIRIGLWQDLDPVEYGIVGHHLQIMGMTGSGKSIGGAWNMLGELITRHDVAVFAADITKGRQTLGPLAAALHRFETTKAGVKAMLRELAERVKARTDYLAARGLQKWKPGCGLTYWVIWLEECPDILDALSDAEMDAFLSMLKAVRSAGGTVVLSLQRSDYTQMPTIARGQLAKACFGVESAADASFGLSERQQDACTPERWMNAQPGMAYLDAPTIPEARVTMPLRTYAWGLDDERASSAMREHAAQWPASAKTVDEWTAEVARLDDGAGDGTAPPGGSGGDGQGEDDDEDDDDVRNVAAEYLTTDDPDPSIQASLADDIPDIDEGDPPLRFARPEQTMTAEQRGAALIAHLQGLWDGGARDFATRDLRPLWEATDMSRQWAQKHLRKLVEAGVLGYDDERQVYLMGGRPEV